MTSYATAPAVWMLIPCPSSAPETATPRHPCPPSSNPHTRQSPKPRKRRRDGLDAAGKFAENQVTMSPTSQDQSRTPARFAAGATVVTDFGSTSEDETNFTTGPDEGVPSSGLKSLISAPLDVPEAVAAGELQGGAEQGSCAFVVTLEKHSAPVKCGFGGTER